MLNRRKLITGLISFAAAPAIVRAESLMKIKIIDTFDPQEVFNKLMSYQVDVLYGKMMIGIDPKCAAIWINCHGEILSLTGIDHKDLYIDNSRAVGG